MEYNMIQCHKYLHEALDVSYKGTPTHAAIVNAIAVSEEALDSALCRAAEKNSKGDFVTLYRNLNNCSMRESIAAYHKCGGK